MLYRIHLAWAGFELFVFLGMESHSTDELDLDLYSIFYKNNVTQLINEPTRYSTNGAYLLDLIFVDRYNYVNDSGGIAAVIAYLMKIIPKTRRAH